MTPLFDPTKEPTVTQVCPLSSFLDAAHAGLCEPEGLDRLAGFVLSALVSRGGLTEAEAADAYFEEPVDRTANVRVPAWGDDGWLSWTEGEEPERL